MDGKIKAYEVDIASYFSISNNFFTKIRLDDISVTFAGNSPPGTPCDFMKYEKFIFYIFILTQPCNALNNSGSSDAD